MPCGRSSPDADIEVGPGLNPFGFDVHFYDACVNILTVTKGAVYICMSSSELDVLQKAFRAAGGHWSTFIMGEEHIHAGTL
jgi:hypothetical protein